MTDQEPDRRDLDEALAELFARTDRDGRELIARVGVLVARLRVERDAARDAVRLSGSELEADAWRSRYEATRRRLDECLERLADERRENERGTTDG